MSLPLPGDPDLYGLGVRIGLYSSWVATLLTSVFDQESEGDQRIANLIIQFAIFIGLCVDSGKENSKGASSVITQFLLCGSLSSVTGNGLAHFRHYSGLLRTVFYVALCSYGCWFYFVGLDQWMAQPDYDRYANIAFFNRAPLEGRFRTAGKVLSVMGLIASIVFMFSSLFQIVQRLRSKSHPRSRSARPQVELLYVVVSAGLIAFSISVIEYLIRENNVSGDLSDIRSVGQFIPLLVGLTSAFMVVWRIITNNLLFERKCWFLFYQHL